MSQPQRRSFMEWTGARDLSGGHRVLPRSTGTAAGTAPWQGPAGEGWAVSLHASCSHPCSKSKSRGILSSVRLFKEV